MKKEGNSIGSIRSSVKICEEMRGSRPEDAALI
jgi:hypothetical protein